jgi:hypothetical protein
VSKYLFFILLFSWLSCQTSPAKRANTQDSKSSESNSSNVSPDSETPVDEQVNFPTTFPKVWFATLADSVLLRDTIDVKTQRWVNLYSNSNVLWTGIETDYKEVIPCFGKSRPFTWLQLVQYDKYAYWIYGGCLAPVIFDFSESADAVTPSTERWLVVQKTDSLTFEEMRKNAQADTLHHIARLPAPEKDSIPIKIMVKGRERVIRDNLCSCEGAAAYKLLKEEHGWYIIAGSYWEWGDYWFIRKSDGTEHHTFGSGFKAIPLASPNHRRWVFPSSQGYGKVLNDGVEIFDSKTCRSVGLELPVNESGVGGAVDVVWETDEIFYFQTYLGEYFKVEIKALFE